MLPGEQGLPEEIFSYHSNIVNRVVQFACKEADASLANRVQVLIRTLQLLWYRSSRYQIFCPSCGVNEHTRKGWRPGFYALLEDDLFFRCFRLNANAVAVRFGLLPRRCVFPSPGAVPMN